MGHRRHFTQHIAWMHILQTLWTAWLDCKPHKWLCLDYMIRNDHKNGLKNWGSPCNKIALGHFFGPPCILLPPSPSLSLKSKDDSASGNVTYWAVNTKSILFFREWTILSWMHHHVCDRQCPISSSDTIFSTIKVMNKYIQLPPHPPSSLPEPIVLSSGR